MSSVRRLVPLHAVELSSDPATGRPGDIYYNIAAEELRVYTGDSWQPIGGAISGILEHVHTYDGAIYSVSAVQIPNPGIIDGGDA
jgi:hypothetical protein